MKGWGSLSSINMKLQVDSGKLFSALYVSGLDSTVKLSIERIRHSPLCEYFSLFVLFYAEKTNI